MELFGKLVMEIPMAKTCLYQNNLKYYETFCWICQGPMLLSFAVWFAQRKNDIQARSKWRQESLITCWNRPKLVD